MCEECELLFRFPIIQGCRRELVPKCEDIIGEYEISVMQHSLCAVDGSLFIPGDKASLMYIVESLKPQPLHDVPLAEIEQQDLSTQDLIVDDMAVFESLMKTPKVNTISDLHEAFIRCIEWMLVSYNES